jgi:hypothetical protein
VGTLGSTGFRVSASCGPAAGSFSCRGGPERRAVVALPAFPGSARLGTDVSFSSLS